MIHIQRHDEQTGRSHSETSLQLELLGNVHLDTKIPLVSRLLFWRLWWEITLLRRTTNIKCPQIRIKMPLFNVITLYTYIHCPSCFHPWAPALLQKTLQDCGPYPPLMIGLNTIKEAHWPCKELKSYALRYPTHQTNPNVTDRSHLYSETNI